MSKLDWNQKPAVESSESDSGTLGGSEEKKLREELARELARCRDLEASAARQKAELEARGRVLFCLFNMSELMEKPAATFQEILEGAVHLISCQGLFSRRASARIVWGDQHFLSEGFKESSRRVLAPIETPHQQGSLEVFLEGEGPEGAIPSGFEEEQWLVEVIANRLRIALERKWAEEELKRLNNLYMTEHHHRKYLSRRLLDLMEGDRRQMAMELHDHIGQLWPP